jgi:hypothetical protein
MQDIGRGLRGCRTETPSTVNGSFSRSALSAQPCQIFAAAAWNRGSSGDFAARIGAVLRARELVEKNPLSPIVDSTAFAASLAQHLTIIFLIDKPVCGRLTMRQTECRGEAGGLSCVGRSARLDMRDWGAGLLSISLSDLLIIHRLRYGCILAPSYFLEPLLRRCRSGYARKYRAQFLAHP